MRSTNFTALGTMPNAPLVLVLAQVRFLPSSQAGHLDVLRDQVVNVLGQEFPNIVPIYSLTLQITQGADGQSQQHGAQSLVGFDFRSADQCAVVRLSQDSLTLAVNSYHNFEQFMATWSRALSVLSTAGVSYVMRVGLRYVDFIYPSQGRVPEEYVVAPFDFRTEALDGRNSGEVQSCSHMQERKFQRGFMRLQYSRGIGNASLPTELQGLLEVNSVNAPSPIGEASAILDTDRWIEERVPSDVSSLQEAFALLHTDVGNAFRNYTTALAIEEWSTPRSNA